MELNRPVLLIIAGAGVVAAGALAGPAWQHLRETPPARPLALRLALAPPDDLSLGGGPDHPFGLALAPDRRWLALAAARAGSAQLWLRDVTTGETHALPGTDGGAMPFWSADGQHLGFFAGGRLKSITLENRQITDLASAPSPRGGSWHRDGDIVFAPDEGGLFRRRASDGAVGPFTSVDAATGETSHRFPVFLEDGRHVVFFVRANESARSGIWIAPIDRPDRRTRLASSHASAIAAGDWILYASEDALLAQQIDGLADADAKPMLRGRGTLVGTPVGGSPINQLSATVAGDLIVYGAPVPQLRELRWVDRAKLNPSALAAQIEAWSVRVAPRGDRVAVAQADPQLGTLDIFVYEGSRPLPRKISQAIDADDAPAWSPDASRLAWVTGRRTITVRGAQAELPDQPLGTFDGPVRVWDWSPDGQRLVIGQTRPATKDDLWLLPAKAGGEPTVYAQSPFNETQAAIAPDGRWIAYTSDESGRPEIYVDSFPAPGHRSRVTNSGGAEPRWAPSGHELFFRRGSEVHAVSLSTAGTTREAVSSARVLDAGADIRAYDVSANGQRVLLNLPAPAPATRPITVVVNWRSLLGK